jgi:DNA gyrase subunit A
MGRATYGVRGITLRPGDRVVAMEELEPEGEILTVATHGYGKRTPVDSYRRQSRGGLGIISLKVSDKTGEVIGTRLGVPHDGLMLITQEGMIIRINVAGIRIVGRSTQGVKLMDLEGTDRLVAMAKVAREEEEVAVDPGDGNGEGGGGVAVKPEMPAGAEGDLTGIDDTDGIDDIVDLAESEPSPDRPETPDTPEDTEGEPEEPVN